MKPFVVLIFSILFLQAQSIVFLGGVILTGGCILGLGGAGMVAFNFGGLRVNNAQRDNNIIANVHVASGSVGLEALTSSRQQRLMLVVARTARTALSPLITITMQEGLFEYHLEHYFEARRRTFEAQWARFAWRKYRAGDANFQEIAPIIEDFMNSFDSVALSTFGTGQWDVVSSSFGSLARVREYAVHGFNANGYDLLRYAQIFFTALFWLIFMIKSTMISVQQNRSRIVYMEQRLHFLSEHCLRNTKRILDLERRVKELNHQVQLLFRAYLASTFPNGLPPASNAAICNY